MRDFFFLGCGGTGLYLSVEAEPGGFVSSQSPWTCTVNSRLDSETLPPKKQTIKKPQKTKQNKKPAQDKVE